MPNSHQHIRLTAAPTPAGQPVLGGRLAMEKFDCGICGITYEDIRPGCPLCEARRDADGLRAALRESQAALRDLSEKYNRTAASLDVIVAIQQAAKMLDDHDVEFFKRVLYQWRDEKSVSLKVTHSAPAETQRGRSPGARGRNAQGSANGFIVMPRRGEPWGHGCSSIGGLAIASYYEEATNGSGAATAMGMLARGLQSLLPGGLAR